jgi:hypothetical protein
LGTDIDEFLEEFSNSEPIAQANGDDAKLIIGSGMPGIKA